ncbi:MAG: tetraacyldisaccharide 4'-kinase [Azospirillaceae bacterium]
MKAPGFWYRPPGLLAGLLSPLGAVYGFFTRRRLSSVRPFDPGVPVICAGNLVAGGQGKTPLAIALAARLTARGRQIGFITRGYGGQITEATRVDPLVHSAVDVGDEPLLLAAHGPVYVGRRRPAAARLAVADGADVLIMDDGFQNPSLVKDLSLVVVDGGSGFGNGRLIPAGPLRERVADGLARADAVVIIGRDALGVARQVRQHAGDLPILPGELVPDDDARRLAGQTVVAFAGIGRPHKFFAMLDTLGADVISRYSFADHHTYRPDDMQRLVEMAAAAEAMLVTTTKDFARLPPDIRKVVEIVEVSIAFADDAAVDRLLDRALGRRG